MMDSKRNSVSYGRANTHRRQFLLDLLQKFPPDWMNEFNALTKSNGVWIWTCPARLHREAQHITHIATSSHFLRRHCKNNVDSRRPVARQFGALVSSRSRNRIRLLETIALNFLATSCSLDDCGQVRFHVSLQRYAGLQIDSFAFINVDPFWKYKTLRQS